MSELTATAAVDIRERLSAAERQIRDSGVTYNVYADPQGLDRPWHLDVLPLMSPGGRAFQVDGDGLTTIRTPAQVLAIAGGFFPSGVNGNIR